MAGKVRVGVHAPIAAAVIGIAVATPGVAQAGMPVITLSDLASARLETLSFFGLVVVVVAFAIQRMWKRLQRDFERLPTLSFRGALAAVMLWGLAMHLVLAMISGARELMTPGAWLRDGATYRLRGLPPATRDEQLRHGRLGQLERLRTALWQYAERNDGRFPIDDYASDIAEPRWQVLDPSGMHFVYVTGSRVDDERRPLVFEPGIYGRERFVLFTDGAIEAWPIEQIRAALAKPS